MPVQNELTFRQMVDGIAALVAVLTPDGAVEDVNDKVLDYFGTTLEALKGWTTSDAVHPDDLTHVAGDGVCVYPKSQCGHRGTLTTTTSST